MESKGGNRPETMQTNMLRRNVLTGITLLAAGAGALSPKSAVARPSTSIGFSFQSGPSRYYSTYRDPFPCAPVYSQPHYGRSTYQYSYSRPVYVTPPPVVYYSSPPVYYSSPAPSYSYSVPYTVPNAPAAPAVDLRIVQVQENLRRLGYYRGAVDGIIGAGTREAVRSYQIDRGLPVTGRIDSALLQDFGL